MRWSTKRKGNKDGYLVENVGAYGEDVGYGDDPRRKAAEVERGPRHDGVRDPRGRAGGHSHFGNLGFPPPFARALGCHRQRHNELIGPSWWRSGQSTVEFAVVTAGFLAMVVALSAMWRVLGGGLFVEHAVAVASHHLQAVAPTTIVDIFLY